MKKGKTTLMALTLGTLTYLAWLGLDIKNPEQPTPVSTPYEVVSESPAPALAALPTPRRVIARKSVKFKKVKTAATVPADQIASAPETEAPKKSKKEIPLPKAWEGSFVKHERPYNKDACDDDRPCAPRGRDGVLLVGVSFSLNGYQPVAPEILSVGSYRERTPLLVYK